MPFTRSPDSLPMPDRLTHAAATDRGAVQQLQEQLGREGFAQLVTTFLDRAPARLAELRAAAVAGDASAVREHAHSLKGAARCYGAAEMGELALRLEQESAAGSLAGAQDLIAALEAALERTQAEFRAPEPPAAASGANSAPAPPEARISELERRIALLEQSVVGLLSRLN